MSWGGKPEISTRNCRDRTAAQPTACNPPQNMSSSPLLTSSLGPALSLLVSLLLSLSRVSSTLSRHGVSTLWCSLMNGVSFSPALIRNEVVYSNVLLQGLYVPCCPVFLYGTVLYSQYS